jgi:hypothetical protein
VNTSFLGGGYIQLIKPPKGKFELLHTDSGRHHRSNTLFPIILPLPLLDVHQTVLGNGQPLEFLVTEFNGEGAILLHNESTRDLPVQSVNERHVAILGDVVDLHDAIGECDVPLAGEPGDSGGSFSMAPSNKE